MNDFSKKAGNSAQLWNSKNTVLHPWDVSWVSVDFRLTKVYYSEQEFILEQLMIMELKTRGRRRGGGRGEGKRSSQSSLFG